MKRYGSRRSDNEIGHCKAIHGSKSGRARERREQERFERDSFLAATVSVLCPDTARRVDVADGVDCEITERSEIPNEPNQPVSD